MNLYYLTTYGSPTWNRTKKTSLEEMHYIRLIMEPDEEDVRFELTDLLQSPVFKTGAIDHSANPPFTKFVLILEYQILKQLVDIFYEFLTNLPMPTFV